MPTDARNTWGRIAHALREHCGLELGDVSDVGSADEFARLVEIAAVRGGEQAQSRKLRGMRLSHSSRRNLRQSRPGCPEHTTRVLAAWEAMG